MKPARPFDARRRFDQRLTSALCLAWLIASCGAPPETSPPARLLDDLETDRKTETAESVSPEVEIGWQELGQVYRPSLTLASDTSIEQAVRLPRSAWLDVALGTPNSEPTTLRISLQSESGEILGTLERTLTEGDQWEEVRWDLLESTRKAASIRFEAEGGLGYFGSPVVRNGSVQQPDPQPPLDLRPTGVVVVVIDTLRRDHLPSYDYERETAPTMTELGRGGVVFADAIAQGVWTKVSMASMLTSMYPTTLGIVDHSDYVPLEITTLAEAFSDAGYATFGASSISFSGRMTNLQQGYDVLHERSSVRLPEGQAPTKTARAMVDRFLPWLERHHDVPFFATIHVMDPHAPYRPYAPWDQAWVDASAPAIHEEFMARVEPLIDEKPRATRSLPRQEQLIAAKIDPTPYLETAIGWYDGSIRATDAEIARILQRLRELHRDEETLIVVTSDHGEEFLDHGGHGHERHVYGELSNVPLLMHWPRGLPAGIRVSQTVQLLDLFPTLAELAKLELPPTIQGTSLVPLIRDPNTEGGRRPRPAIVEWKKQKIYRDLPDVDAVAIIHDGWKLIHNTHRPAGQPEYELFSHATDPLDQVDRAAEEPQVVDRLGALLGQWSASAVGPWSNHRRNDRDQRAEQLRALTAEEADALRSLGYVD